MTNTSACYDGNVDNGNKPAAAGVQIQRRVTGTAG